MRIVCGDGVAIKIPTPFTCFSCWKNDDDGADDDRGGNNDQADVGGGDGGGGGGGMSSCARVGGPGCWGLGPTISSFFTPNIHLCTGGAGGGNTGGNNKDGAKANDQVDGTPLV